MDYTIALSPDLGITSDDFVASWNADPQYRQAAEAQAQMPGASFDPGLLGGAGVVLGSVAVGLLTNALYDLIKEGVRAALTARNRLTPPLVIRRIKLPEGSAVLVVEVEASFPSDPTES